MPFGRDEPGAGTVAETIAASQAATPIIGPTVPSDRQDAYSKEIERIKGLKGGEQFKALQKVAKDYPEQVKHSGSDPISAAGRAYEKTAGAVGETVEEALEKTPFGAGLDLMQFFSDPKMLLIVGGVILVIIFVVVIK